MLDDAVFNAENNAMNAPTIGAIDRWWARWQQEPPAKKTPKGTSHQYYYIEGA
jgi:hypothetical protein